MKHIKLGSNIYHVSDGDKSDIERCYFDYQYAKDGYEKNQAYDKYKIKVKEIINNYQPITISYYTI